ncbi:MAG: primosomal protein N', partial [Candidatus Omnitrophica bacterium]|nr:primosomal protein N' [Candidatus Omnitrophota bacterium]
MLYVKVALGLPVRGPFDYSVPRHIKCIKEGSRVWVQFGSRKILGYVVGITPKTTIKHVKPLLEIIDDSPLLDKNMLLLAKKLSDYYGCSWGEAIETALPEVLRKGKKITNIAKLNNAVHKPGHEAVLIHDLNAGQRWDIYLAQIKDTVAAGKSVIVLLPDINSVLKAKETISSCLGVSPVILYRKQPQELEAWLKVKEAKFSIVAGTRSGIFAPVNNLGLVIIDEEQDNVYKQDQVPHYHARDVVSMRCEIENANLVLGSSYPSLESFYAAKKEKAKYILLSRAKNYPQVTVLDMSSQGWQLKQKNTIVSKYLGDCIAQALDSKGKVLVFLNRRGFATSASCRNCGTVLRCPRCDINLVYYFKDNILNCRYCNFKMEPPKICPNCNSAYMRYLGTGTEKMESEISRIFPASRIAMLEDLRDFNADSADIFISTASVIRKTGYNFDLIGVLAIDNTLNRVDFRSTEKAFGLLSGLLALTDKKVVIQTGLPKHYCLKAIENNDVNIFYDEELALRKQLGFPPYRHLCLVKLRGKKENSVKEASNALFSGLSKYAENDKFVKVVSLNPGQPEKLRG